MIVSEAGTVRSRKRRYFSKSKKAASRLSPGIMNPGSISLFDRVGHVDSVLVLEEPKEVRELLELAGVKPDEPINTLGIQLLGWIPFKDANGTPVLRSEHPAFLPLQPAWNFYALVSRRHRIRKYFERFAARSQASGWLLIPHKDYAKWTQQLPAITHRPGRTFRNEYGRLVWMKYGRGAGPAARNRKALTRESP